MKTLDIQQRDQVGSHIVQTCIILPGDFCNSERPAWTAGARMHEYPSVNNKRILGEDK